VNDAGTKKKTCMAIIYLTMHKGKKFTVYYTLRFPTATTACACFAEVYAP
jgi:hypothetical protein